MNSELVQLIKDELNVKKVAFVQGKELKVKLDIKITPQLEKEGQVRDIIRIIQQARKEAGCQLDQLITIQLPQWPKQFEQEIKSKTLTKKIIKAKQVKIIC